MVTPFINFSGRCNEAISFYEKVFNGQNKQILRFGDAPATPDFQIAESMKDYILHAEMTICGTKVSFSDTQQSVVPGNMISLAVNFPTADEVTNVFNKLKEDGKVLMELSPQFFSSMYGWVEDKFGIGWQIICQ